MVRFGSDFYFNGDTMCSRLGRVKGAMAMTTVYINIYCFGAFGRQTFLFHIYISFITARQKQQCYG